MKFVLIIMVWAQPSWVTNVELKITEFRSMAACQRALANVNKTFKGTKQRTFTYWCQER